VRANLLAIAGRTDRIAPPAAVRAQTDVVGSADTAFRLAPGGHMGVFAGASAPRQVWHPIAEWLAARSVARPMRARGTAHGAVAGRAVRGPQHTRRSALH
jgi:polyhydroxyalkanoate synthase